MIDTKQTNVLSYAKTLKNEGNTWKQIEEKLAAEGYTTSRGGKYKSSTLMNALSRSKAVKARKRAVTKTKQTKTVTSQGTTAVSNSFAVVKGLIKSLSLSDTDRKALAIYLLQL